MRPTAKWVAAQDAFAFLAAACFATEKSEGSRVEAAVTDLLSKMTLEEKVGQMTQVTLEVISKEKQGHKSAHQIDMEKLRTALITYHVGSILNVVNSAYDVDHWHEIITQIQDVATKETRLKIPVLYGIDAVHGANYILGATIFPHNLGMAATWNPGLMKKNGEITAYEVRASGIPWNFSPVLDVGRQPLWPRLFETFGEDPHLASVMGAAYVKGLEGDDNNIAAPDKVAACMKHYLGYSFPLSGKDRTPAWIPENMLREYFLPPFKAAIEAGAHTIMINSSEINGIPVHCSHYLLTELLRNELGFKGFAVSDWQDVISLYTRERVAESPKEAVRMAVMAGVDMSMVPYDFSFHELLLQLVKEGSVPQSRIDEAVARILRVKYELGLFTNPYPNRELKKKLGSEEFRAVSLEAARESITLLKNSGNLLPLAKNKKVLVTGPTATKRTSLNGGWTITWQGNDETLYPKDKKNILQAIEGKIGLENVIFVPGATIDEEIDIAAAAEAARQVDVAIVCLGEEAYCESEGNITDLTLPEAQLRLAEAVEKSGTPTVIVLAEGRPRIINRVVDNAEAILMAYLPGMEGALAIADVLFGDCNPSGRLPITYPRYPNDFTLYDHKHSEDVDGFHQYNPQFPFGFGLSYATFAYSDLQLDKKAPSDGEPINVSVKVTNTGKRAGKEVVQLYVSDLVASVTPATKRLRRFTKIHLEPGQSETVTFTLDPMDFAFIGHDNKPVVEPGEFKITVGNLSETFVLRQGNRHD